MIKCVSVELCEKTSQDPRGGLSLLTCFDGLFTSDVPFAVNNLSMSINWFNYGINEDSVKFKIEAMTPDGKTSLLMDNGEEAIKSHRGHRSNILMNGFPIENYGLHEFVVTAYFNDDTKSETRIPLMIDKLEKPD